MSCNRPHFSVQTDEGEWAQSSSWNEARTWAHELAQDGTTARVVGLHSGSGALLCGALLSVYPGGREMRSVTSKPWERKFP